MDGRRVLDLTDRFFRATYSRVPTSWLAADVTMTQFKALLTIYIDGPQNSSSLASSLGLSLPTLTGILNRLARAGYVRRRRDQRDGRRVISVLSKKGNEMIDGLFAAGRAEFAQVLRGVTEEDLNTIEKALEILTRAVESEAPPAGHKEVSPA